MTKLDLNVSLSKFRSVMSGRYRRGKSVESGSNDVIVNGFSHPEENGYSHPDEELDVQFKGPAQTQNFKASRIYVFGEDDVDEQEVNTDNIPFEMTEMRSRGKCGQLTSQNENVNTEAEYLNWTIKEDDTLQNIALKFGCQVSELKRINNLIRDQDFYALPTIKIPISRHGVLSELRDELEAGPSRSERLASESASDYDDGDSESQKLLVRTVSIRDALSSQGREAAKFLQRMDTDIHNIIESTKNRMETLDEVTKSLTCRRIYPLEKPKGLFNGVDCGMRWWSLLAMLVVIAIILPTLYILYIKYIKPSS